MAALADAAQYLAYPVVLTVRVAGTDSLFGGGMHPLKTVGPRQVKANY